MSGRKAVGGRALHGDIDVGPDVAGTNAADRVLQKQLAEQQHQHGGDQHDRRSAARPAEKEHHDTDNEPHDPPLSEQRELGHQKVKQRASHIRLYPVEYLKVDVGDPVYQGNSPLYEILLYYTTFERRLQGEKIRTTILTY